MREFPRIFTTREEKIKTCTHVDEDTSSCEDECAQSHVIPHTYKRGLHRAHIVCALHLEKVTSLFLYVLVSTPGNFNLLFNISHLIWDFNAKFPIKIY